MEKDYLIEKWLKNDLSAEEKESFEALPNADAYKQIIDGASYFKASHHSEIPSFEVLEQKVQGEIKVKKLNWIQPMMRIAAVAVVAIGLYFIFFASNITKVETAASEKTEIVLPDNSTVILNALSEISYSKGKWEDNRVVNLEGEAYFKVAKGAKFSVQTSEGIVTVLGTQFNVKQRGDFFDVTCYEGRVSVVASQATKELLPGDTFRIDGEIVSFSSTNHQQPLWTENLSNFKSVPFEQVVSELERQYNIEISYDAKIANQLFSGGFVHDNLENALKSITRPLKLSYKIEMANKVSLTNNEE